MIQCNQPCFSLCLSDSFWTNPQYRVKIDKLLSECSTKQGEKNMLVSLMQKPDKRHRRLIKTLHIGFSVYKVNITFYCVCHSVKAIRDLSDIQLTRKLVEVVRVDEKNQWNQKILNLLNYNFAI